MPRLDQLKEMLEQDPDDAFVRYALALEYRKAGLIEEAADQFEQTIGRHAEYVPAYFMLGQMLADEGRTADAAQRLREGIAMAHRAGDSHAQAEMQDLLESLEG
ncbi:MAG: tetratricopeptide repeat protein [bacterium]|nr:tetratricopeptide repeat protein [bacterium]